MQVGHRHMEAGQPLCTLFLLLCQPSEPHCTTPSLTSGYSMSREAMGLGGLNDQLP